MVLVLVYLTVSSLTQTIRNESNDWIIVNNELEIMQKEGVVPEFKVLSQCLHGETKGNHEKPQDNGCLCRDSTRSPFE
jgi:hypothetical protein